MSSTTAVTAAGETHSRKPDTRYGGLHRRFSLDVGLRLCHLILKLVLKNDRAKGTSGPGNRRKIPVWRAGEYSDTGWASESVTVRG